MTPNDLSNPNMATAPGYGEALFNHLGMQSQALQQSQRQKLLDSMSRVGGLSGMGQQTALAGQAKEGADQLYGANVGAQLQGAQANQAAIQAKQQRDWQGNQNVQDNNLKRWLTASQLGQDQGQFNTERQDTMDNRALNMGMGTAGMLMKMAL